MHFCQTKAAVACRACVLSRDLSPRGEGTRDEALRTSSREARAAASYTNVLSARHATGKNPLSCISSGTKSLLILFPGPSVIAAFYAEEITLAK